jgi:hypothetical protein
MIITKVGHSTKFKFTSEIDLQVDDVWPRGCFQMPLIGLAHLQGYQPSWMHIIIDWYWHFFVAYLFILEKYWGPSVWNSKLRNKYAKCNTLYCVFVTSNPIQFDFQMFWQISINCFLFSAKCFANYVVPNISHMYSI